MCISNFIPITYCLIFRADAILTSKLFWFLLSMSLSFTVSILETRAPRGTDRSPEYNEHFCYKLDSRVKNLTTEWNQKQQHFITHASVCCCSLPVWRRSFLKKGTPVTYFASPWIRHWANMAKTSLCMCRAMSTSSLPSFINIH